MLDEPKIESRCRALQAIVYWTSPTQERSYVETLKGLRMNRIVVTGKSSSQTGYCRAIISKCEQIMQQVTPSRDTKRKWASSFMIELHASSV